MRKLWIILLSIPLILVAIFFIVTGAIYIAGGYNTPEPSSSPAYFQNPINPNNNSVGFMNVSGDEQANIDKDNGNIITQGNITANYTRGGYGYFKFLGDSLNKITTIFATTVNATDFQGSGINITDVNADKVDTYHASYFMPLNTSVSGTFNFNNGWTNGGLTLQGGDVYAQTGYFYNITALSVSTLNMNGSIVPSINNTFNIGSTGNVWQNGYFSTDVQINGQSIKQWMYNQTTATFTLYNSSWDNRNLIATVNASLVSGTGMNFSNVAMQNQTNNFTQNQVIGGNITVNGDSQLGNLRLISMTRAMPTTLNNEVDIGNFTFSVFGGTLDIWVDADGGGYTVSKRYIIPIKYAQTSSTWQTVLPTSSSSSYNSNDFDLVSQKL